MTADYPPSSAVSVDLHNFKRC